MRSLITGLVLTLTVAAGALLAPAAHADDRLTLLQGKWTWTIPAGPNAGQVLLFKVDNPADAVAPDPGGEGQYWFEYHANVTMGDGTPLMTTDDQGNSVPVNFTITAKLHGNGSSIRPYLVETTYAIQVGGQQVGSGRGQLRLSGDQNFLSGSLTDDIDQSVIPLTLQRYIAPPDTPSSE